MLLWKNWRGGVTVLVSATALWYLFERAGYNFLSFVANVVLLLVVILFLWAKAANLLNRYNLYLQIIILHLQAYHRILEKNAYRIIDAVLIVL